VGTIFKKTFTKPLPAGADTFVRKGERFARWKDRKGKTRTALLTVGKDGTERILLESPYYVAQCRNAGGLVQVVSTGCRDETAARRVLADLERKAELVRSGLMSAAESAAAQHQTTPLEDHITAYMTYIESAGACAEHRSERERQLRRLAHECGFARLTDLKRETLESWLTQQARKGMSARTRNSYLASALAFCNWCLSPTVGRLTHNPFDGVAKANEKADPRRQRRAMTQDELVRLLDVALRRPLLDALTVRKGKRKGERYAKVRPEVRERLELLGKERALIYKTLVLTGLRKGELTSLTVGQLHLDEPIPYAALDAADEKNREGNEIPLRDDLTADLRGWLASKLTHLQAEAREHCKPIPAQLPPDTPVFDVPDKLCKILNRDLKQAGIPKRDERGRVLDVHALRHTFGTLLSKGGVAPRTAQAAMRHSKIDLTMSVYTDPKLLDVAGALDTLPALPLDSASRQENATALATGTDGRLTQEDQRTLAQLLAQTLAGNADKPGSTLSILDNSSAADDRSQIYVSVASDKRKEPLTTPVSGSMGVGAIGLEPMTPSLSKCPFISCRIHEIPLFLRHFTLIRGCLQACA
jgi:integrase